MRLFHRNRPDHLLLLMPVRLGNERRPKNKVWILSCDTEGHLFTQLVGRSTYQRIREETQQMEDSQNNYATIYWDTGASRFTPLIVEIGNKQTWALERILEHALRSATIPDILRRYPEEIIKLGESKHQELLIEKTGETHKTTAATSSKVLGRLPYYRKQDVEVSIPIYKAEYAFPLIILKRLSQAKNTPPGQQRLLVLDSDGDLAVTTLHLEQINKAKRRLDNLHRKGKAGYLICLRNADGVSVDVIEISGLQRQALETVTRYFEETGKGKQPISDAVKKVLNKARDTVLS
ncbi:hypothetical protein ACFLT4_04340 [Chloroflexota bacterium]